MSDQNHSTFTCPICKKQLDSHVGTPLSLVTHPVDDAIRAEHPEIKSNDLICQDCRSRYRSDYVGKILETEKGEMTRLEKAVVDSMSAEELIARNVDAEFKTKLTVGDRISDKVASFGGSWAFIIGFGVVLVVWITANTVALMSKPFDPFPFILLNLVLSCVAALQAPVIMMSQNRQEAKDRLRSEHDYQVNLKAEIEIRQLHVKLDQLLTHQWQRLLEIQKLQIDLMEDLSKRAGDGKS
ncbi:MAG: DUF1003 domain-containing protein [Candidatus Zixiibacteriota bacterium]